VSGIVQTSYKDRFRVDSPSTGDYNLVIKNVEVSDGGRYTCIEEAGVGRRHPIQLHVISDGKSDNPRVTYQIILSVNRFIRLESY